MKKGDYQWRKENGFINSLDRSIDLDVLEAERDRIVSYLESDPGMIDEIGGYLARVLAYIREANQIELNQTMKFNLD